MSEFQSFQFSFFLSSDTARILFGVLKLLEKLGNENDENITGVANAVPCPLSFIAKTKVEC